VTREPPFLFDIDIYILTAIGFLPGVIDRATQIENKNNYIHEEKQCTKNRETHNTQNGNKNIKTRKT
jgi:hypothetical protein